jgi:PleD family two-component response regulator
MKIERKTILAIDDDITVLTTIRTILEKDYEICLAKSAEIAKTILNTVLADLILLDMEMPGISGLDFMAFLRKDPSTSFIPVIIVSSHGTADYIIAAKKSGARDFVVKPIHPKILQEKIEGVLNSSPARTPRDMQIRNLSLLAAACKQGKGSQVEALVTAAEAVKLSRAADAAVADICACAVRLDYALAIRKIEKLLLQL